MYAKFREEIFNSSCILELSSFLTDSKLSQSAPDRPHQKKAAITRGQARITFADSESYFRQTPAEECSYLKLSREDKRRQRRASSKYRMAHATRERLRVEVGGGSFLHQVCSWIAVIVICFPTKRYEGHHRHSIVGYSSNTGLWCVHVWQGLPYFIECCNMFSFLWCL